MIAVEIDIRYVEWATRMCSNTFTPFAPILSRVRKVKKRKLLSKKIFHGFVSKTGRIGNKGSQQPALV